MYNDDVENIKKKIKIKLVIDVFNIKKIKSVIYNIFILKKIYNTIKNNLKKKKKKHSYSFDESINP